MRLTPADIQAITFQRAQMGRGGYDETHVDSVFDQVQQEIVQLLNERTQLTEEVARLRQRVYGETVDGALGARPPDAHVQAVRILSKAQQTADRYVADAEEYGRQLAKEARRSREDILSDARARAQLIQEEAHGQAQRAAAAAAEATGAAPQGGTPGLAVAGGAADSRALEAEITYLRTFSEVYRQHLRSYLEALLHNIVEWERSERSTPASNDVSRLENAARAQLANGGSTPPAGPPAAGEARPEPQAGPQAPAAPPGEGGQSGGAPR
jgi:DivIVA domain-containing protein